MTRSELVSAAAHEDLLESHLARHSTRSTGIYLLLTFAFLVACASLPMLYVSLSVQGRGLIRPEVEKHEIGAPAAGFVVHAVPAAATVRVGDTLLLLRTDVVRVHSEPLRLRIAEREQAIHDLELLTRRPVRGIDAHSLRLPRYREELVVARTELSAGDDRAARAAADAERAATLLRLALAPRMELEERESRVAQIRSETALALQRYRARWQSELAEVRAELAELRSEAERLHLEARLYSVVAPVAGTVEEAASLSPGSFVQAGQRVAVLSPATPLVADVFVSPADIGLVRTDASVRLQIDAFRYTDWGFIQGRVTEISDDFVMWGGQPAFRVRVRPEATTLALRNGARGELRKGMTLTARFTVARRSLWQLLRDDVSDWLDPARHGIEPRTTGGA